MGPITFMFAGTFEELLPTVVVMALTIVLLVICNKHAMGESHTSALHTNGQSDFITGKLVQALEVRRLDASVNSHCTGLEALWRL